VTTPLIEITYTAFECAKVLGVKVVVDLLPLLLNPFGTVTSKIMQTTKLLENSFLVDTVSCRIPFNAALPVVVVCEPVLSALPHD
jgi:hypothetical protein